MRGSLVTTRASSGFVSSSNPKPELSMRIVRVDEDRAWSILDLVGESVAVPVDAVRVEQAGEPVDALDLGGGSALAAGDRDQK
jgi:hypothetical protein